MQNAKIIMNGKDGFLNQARAWFIEITFTVRVYVRVRVCVCTPPRP